MSTVVGMPRAFKAVAMAPSRVQQDRQPGDVMRLIPRPHRVRAAAIGRQRQHGDVGGASALDSASSEGISATQGAHQVAHMFTTMPRPLNSARRWRSRPG